MTSPFGSEPTHLPVSLPKKMMLNGNPLPGNGQELMMYSSFELPLERVINQRSSPAAVTDNIKS